LSALTIAIGRVVDDSIVVLENIKRHLEYGEEKGKATLSAVRDVAGAVTASTLTTVAVFLPISFTGSFVGELFASFSVTVTVALLASLLVSLTVVPVLAYWFLKVPSVGSDPEEVREEALAREHRSILQRAYVPVIVWATRHRVITLALAFVVFAGSMSLIPRLETNFLGDSGQNTLTIEQELPAGTSLAATDEAAERVETAIEDVDGVEAYQVTIGSDGAAALAPPGGGGSSGSNSATFSEVTDEDADQAVIEEDLREAVSGVEDAGDVTVSAGDMAVGNSDLEVIVQASDEGVLREASDRVEGAIADTPNTTEVASNLSDGETGISVRVDGRAVAEQGLTETGIGQAVSAAMQVQGAAEVDLDGESRDVFVGTGSDYDSVEGLRDLEIPTATGSVRLDEVADVAEVEIPTQVTRIDGERSASITATPTTEDTGSVSTEMQQRLDDLELPQGASYSIGGVTSDQTEAFGSLALALVVAILLVYVVMVATFRSIVQPLMLMVSIPFAATGAVVLLLATDTAAGLAALIGLLMLVGIVVTNPPISQNT
jgi:hydrophobic/amphiphilic exporter-1 (mainly G- bacteria), HAE1 family